MTAQRRSSLVQILLGCVLLAFPWTPAAHASAPADEIAQAIQHNLDAINALRSKAGAPPLVLDPVLNTFAQAGAEELRKTHVPHGHFQHADIWKSGFQSGAAENQGDPHGWPVRGGLNDSIDAILQFMMSEGPGGGHHDNLLNPKFHRLGVGLVMEKGGLYFTNDFSQ